jgi:hypothetical protein
VVDGHRDAVLLLRHPLHREHDRIMQLSRVAAVREGGLEVEAASLQHTPQSERICVWQRLCVRHNCGQTAVEVLLQRQDRGGIVDLLLVVLAGDARNAEQDGGSFEQCGLRG